MLSRPVQRAGVDEITSDGNESREREKRRETIDFVHHSTSSCTPLLLLAQ